MPYDTPVKARYPSEVSDSGVNFFSVIYSNLFHWTLGPSYKETHNCLYSMICQDSFINIKILMTNVRFWNVYVQWI